MTQKKSRSAGLDRELRRRLGQNLRRARLGSGRTLEEIAGYFGLNPNMVWRWEAGRSAPMVERLAKLATLYGVSVDELLGTAHETPDAFLTAVEQATSGLAEEDLELVLDFARLVRQRRQRRSASRQLSMAAEDRAAYDARSRPHPGQP